MLNIQTNTQVLNKYSKVEFLESKRILEFNMKVFWITQIYELLICIFEVLQ